MTPRRWMLVGAVVILIVVEGAYLALRPDEPTVSITPTAPATATPTTDPSPSPTQTPISSPAPTASPTPSPSPTPVPTPEPTPTDPPVAAGDPRVLYAAFLIRLNDDRSTVTGLNAALTTAAQGQDVKAVKAASVDILEFVDTERDWLRDHPPAACYAAAHHDARAMLLAYGDTADAFIAWAGTGGGLAGASELLTALDAADQAGQALTTFGATLEATRCPA
jgi:hypothetical protein